MANIEEILTKFDFTAPEAELYLLILASDRPSVTDLAKKTGKNRAAVYFHLNHLLAKGYVKTTKEGRRFRYVALPPAEIASRFDRLATDFKSMLPALEAMKRAKQEAPLIEVSESRAGYRRVYDEISSLPGGSEFLVMEGRPAASRELGLLLDEDWRTFFGRVVERKIITRALFTDEMLAIPGKKLKNENFELLRKRAWDLRSLPESVFPIQQLVLLYGRKAAFLLPESKLVVTIEHDAIVKTMISVFDALFSFAKRQSSPWG